MKRIGFRMKLKKGCGQEYQKRHHEIWPDLKKLLKDSGVSDYSIFLDQETGDLFASQKVTDDYDPSKLLDDPLIWRWWEYMSDIMDANDDFSPVTIDLQEVFYMEQER